MNAPAIDNGSSLSPPSWWVRFWHEPVRAETLGFTRILFALSLLAEQLTQHARNLELIFGPSGLNQSDVTELTLARHWRWSVLFFHTDDMTVITVAFWIWTAVTAAFLFGFFTRITAVLTWFGAYCFLSRHYFLLNGGDDMLMCGLFLLMFTPCGAGLSFDSWWKRRRSGDDAPVVIAPWPIRLFQIQLCVMYLTTGLVKCTGTSWWEGTTLHRVFQDLTLVRFSPAQFQIPFWITALLTWSSLAFEVFFTPLVMFRKTRKWTLIGGVLFHLGIYLTMEVGWFSIYTLAMYGAWVPFGRKAESPASTAEPKTAPTETQAVEPVGNAEPAPGAPVPA